ncbi:xrcc4 like factor [Schizosaccharomyces japonicus yFS275]|uniref:Xrcc4 like factor n=1 Tax=Schizosaccharomyces japonicus (strain yFS275 / FY16936) TaxID=402676 RepID=B6K671_SCHJY|nr:xrcc4 like factor [Schizosaccharomyces japonicus yFS275]EEB09025.1 xrcc4 like factor [Schizosaccharomyces japonicus yFS275]
MDWVQLKGHKCHFVKARMRNGNGETAFISLTDLAYIWTCTFRQEDIIQEAERNRCPIDPVNTYDELMEALERLLMDIGTPSRTQLCLSDDRGSIDLLCQGSVHNIQLEWRWRLWMEPPETLLKQVWSYTVRGLLQQTSFSSGSIEATVRDYYAQLQSGQWTKEATEERNARSSPGAESTTPTKRTSLRDLITPSPKRFKVQQPEFKTANDEFLDS